MKTMPVVLALVVAGCGVDAGREDDGDEIVEGGEAPGGKLDDPGATDDLPGPRCEGPLDDAALAALFAERPVVGTPTFVVDGDRQARELGTFTSTLYRRRCDSVAGCSTWAAAERQPNYERFFSINEQVRQGQVYLWSTASGGPRLGLVSDEIVGSWCRGWTQAIGRLTRDGDQASATLAAKVTSDCPAGADPVWRFQQLALYPPAGRVTDHCFKLSWAKRRDVVIVEAGRSIYDEWIVVYDGVY